MATIKLKRGTGSPAGNIEQYEVAMDVAAKNIYTSTDGSDAVILADNTVNTLSGITSTLDISDKVAIEGTAGGINWGTGVIGDSILNLKTDNTGWDKGQLTLEDSNSKVMKMVGEDQTSQSLMKYTIIMDPDGENNTSNGATGDYGFFYNKNYASSTVKMENNVFGARDGFEMSIHDDYNGGSPNPGPFPFAGYGFKPFRILAEEFEVRAKDSDTSTASVFVAKDAAIECKRPVQLPGYQISIQPPSNPSAGMMVYNEDTSKVAFYNGTTWTDL